MAVRREADGRGRPRLHPINCTRLSIIPPSFMLSPQYKPLSARGSFSLPLSLRFIYIYIFIGMDGQLTNVFRLTWKWIFNYVLEKMKMLSLRFIYICIFIGMDGQLTKRISFNVEMDNYVLEKMKMLVWILFVIHGIFESNFQIVLIFW